MNGRMALDVSGDDRLDVVGESFHREALRRVASLTHEDGQPRQYVAALEPEPTNSYDRNAIKVVIEGEHVGYVPREFASLLAEPIARLSTKHEGVTALAELRGSDGALGFGVTLFLKFQMFNVVIVRGDGEDLDDELLLDDDVPERSTSSSAAMVRERTTAEAADALGVSAETLDSRRQTVERAVERWKDDLIDLTARNRLLYFRDLQTGTLSLDDVSRDQLMQLVGGKRVALSKLVPRSLPAKHHASKLTPFEDAVRRVRGITRTARAYEEERGVRTLFLACGVASWTSSRASRPPAAPVLLVPVEIRSRGASQKDFDLSTLGDLEINPTLLHLLRVEFQLKIDPQELFENTAMDGAIDTPDELDLAFEWLSRRCEQVAGWSIAERFVLGNFWYAKLPMVRDLETSIDTLSSHDVAAALAGHSGAKDAVIARRGSSALDLDLVDRLDPHDEFNVLDSDSSQSLAIARVLNGDDLVLKGPPGTGKSQTIANLICNAIGNGKRVLFVAEKRAAIDAVTKRLHAVGLDSLVLDLHRGAESRKWLAAQLGISLEAIRTTGVAEYDDDHAALVRTRDGLSAHVRELHRRVAPWDVSIYDAQLELLRGGRPALSTRLRGETLRALTSKRMDELGDTLRDLLALNGLSLHARQSPWAGADVRNAEHVRKLSDALDHASVQRLSELEAQLRTASAPTGLPAPATLEEADEIVELWDRVAASESTFRLGVYELDLAELSQTLRPLAGGGLARFFASIGSPGFRKANGAVREHWVNEDTGSPSQLWEDLETATRLQTDWGSVATADASPAVPEHLKELQAQLTAVHTAIEQLEAATNINLADRPWDELREATSALAGDRSTLALLPTVVKSRSELAGAGFGPFLDELQARQALLSTAESELSRVWWASIADELMLLTGDAVPLSAFRGERHEATLAAFRGLEERHVKSSAHRVHRAAAEAAVRAQDRHPEQAQIVRSQATRKRGHLAVRELFKQAPDVVTALRPCWVMSPLMVSQLIPSDRAHFDLVVFDEASQVRPVDALSSMIRGRQLVIAGDERQLPPTRFFDAAATQTDDKTEESEDENSEISDYESVLDVLAPLFETEMLRWHYRSRDERLIGFSNKEIYDGSLTTFPGAIEGEVLRHMLVTDVPGPDESRVSPDAEVRRVVSLVLEHAQQRPNESLGVIALGSPHANAIEAGVLTALANRPDLESFFAEDQEERFFVKNLERVQGDERDAIILAIGYGKNPDGTLPHNFGPLNNEGGERRLNVAVSRAKRRMTVVSSFEAQDVDPKRSRATGVLLLRSFLEYAGTGGTPGSEQSGEPASALHRHIEKALTDAGHEVAMTPGASADRLDLAVVDPATGAPVVAIDIDGPSYASRHSVRDRDRLRPEQLVRLGWQYVPVWSQDWYRDPDAATARLLEQVASGLEQAQIARENTEPVGPAAPSLFADIPVEDEIGPPPRAQLEPRIRPERPYFRSGGPAITDWSHEDLVRLAAWIEEDGILRTSEELQREMMQDLGLSRRGSRVAAALDAAVAALRERQ